MQEEPTQADMHRGLSPAVLETGILVQRAVERFEARDAEAVLAHV